MRKKLKGLLFSDSPCMPDVCLIVTETEIAVTLYALVAHRVAAIFISVMLSTSISLNLNEYRMPTSAVSDEHYT